ncbi:MAG: hypothetical protein MK193_02525 [Lentisphaeria bacterium]|nr:hypothetical protein [Lentisphaeria bacterium]
MKKYLLLIAFTFAFCSIAGGIRLPSSSFNMDELDDAMKKAKQKKYPIFFLYTDKDSSCPLCNNAGKAAIKALRTSTVMVYVTGKDYSKLPEAMQAGFKKGKYIPKIGVMDVEAQNVLGVVLYEEIKTNGKDAFDDLKKDIKSYRKEIKYTKF